MSNSTCLKIIKASTILLSVLCTINQLAEEVDCYLLKKISHLNNYEAAHTNYQFQKTIKKNQVSNEHQFGNQFPTNLQLINNNNNNNNQVVLSSNGKCPLLDTQSTAGFLAQTNSHDKVHVDSITGRRTFNARIVGIFSCLDTYLPSNDLTLDFRLAKPAIDLAVKAVNNKYPNMRFNVTYRTAPDICKHQQAAGHAADEYYVNGANYFVGPGCSESLASVGQLASYWNVPMCSTGYLPEMVTARFNPLTLMQLSLSVQSIGEMLLELFQMYKWRHLVIVTDEKHPLHSLIRDGLLEFFHTLYMPTSQTAPALLPTLSAASAAAAAAAVATAATTTSLAGSSLSAALENSAASNLASFPNSFPNQVDGLYSNLPATLSPLINQQNTDNHLHYKNNHYHHQQQHQHHESISNIPTPGTYPNKFSQPYYINITSRNFAYSKKKPVDYEQVMLDAASNSRVMLILARSSTIGNLLEAAHNQGMSKGQFVFIAHELFETQMFNENNGDSSSSSSSSSNSSPKSSQQQSHGFTMGGKQKYSFDEKIEIQSVGNATHDQLTREIFRPLMTISLRIPTTPEFDTFRSDVADLSEREFKYRIQPTSLKSLYSLGVAALIHDCVMLYADKVNYVLNHTKYDFIDGKTIFDLAADRTFSGALTGDLKINKAGQRVIDFTLNDFSPETLSLDPIAHFAAMKGRLNFLAGKAPHWVVRNQPVPRSDPRCRINDLFCKYSDEELQDAHYINSDRVVLGVWLLVIIIVSVTSTSSIIGWLVYRRFRIESELLNLWWSIKYEDILFEDEADAMCDVKRSMSSLAISNESFNEQQSATIGCNKLAEQSSGRASPKQQQHRQQQQRDSQVIIENHNSMKSQANNNNNADCQSTGNMQLSVCHSLAQDGTVLSTAHSASTLSVTAPSIGGGSISGLAAAAATNTTAANNNQQSQYSSPVGLRAKTGNTTSSQGASKLIPLINKATSGISGSGKFSGSSGQLGTGGKTVGGGGAGGRAGVHYSSTGANNKDPSISSQNKNVKLRLGTVLNGTRDHRQTTKVGLYKASRVAAKHLNVRNLNINRQLLIELRQVRDLTHENLIKFIGLCPEEPNIAIISELCTRGNLQDLLQNETIRLDWPFRYSIINDIVDGLIHLHSSPIQYHGRLKSSNCVIDNRFVVKLTDFGLPTLLAAVELEENVNPRLLLWTAPEHLRTKHPLLSGSQKGDIYSLAIIFQEIITRCGPFECEPILCGASEVLGGQISWQPEGGATNLAVSAAGNSMQAPLIKATDAGGQQIAAIQTTRRSGTTTTTTSVGKFQPVSTSNLHQAIMPFGNSAIPLFQPLVVQHKQRLEPEEIVNLVRMGLSPPFRPYFRPDVAAVSASGGGATTTNTAAGGGGNSSGADFNVADLIAIVQNCWQESPTNRPTVTSVKQQIKKMRRGCHLDSANIMDNLLQRMERYTDNLESLVEQKTAELMEEKKRSEELLYEMLPRFVVDQLKYGHSVTPEAYEAVTISFSDIKDFTSIAAQSSPIEVVNLLNQLYTEFDDCIARYDVYKVETIGDAYMVVSGLPVRNGDQHAKEIAEMSLALLDLIRNFDVVHLPHVNLELRIGIHSGPCASGVVGTRMFRYCLFGDTVSYL